MSDILRAHGWKVGAGAYALAALFTFGYAAGTNERWVAHHCATFEQRIQDETCTAGPTMVGLFSAAFWPLYWSWELQTPSARP